MVKFGSFFDKGKNLADKAADAASKAALAAVGAATAAGEALSESAVGDAASIAKDKAAALVSSGTEILAESGIIDAASAARDKASEFVEQSAEALSGTAVGTAAQAAKEKAAEFADQGAEYLGVNTDDGLDEYDVAIIEYNAAYTDMSDGGVRLFRMRERSVDLIQLIEHLVNSIANTPKEFQTDFQEIETERKAFADAEQFAKEKLDAARITAAGGGAGVAAGVAVASMAPTAAMWVATTFGTASTGAAISTLSGAAAHSAALAWLGGGALAAGGGGMAAGNALLAMAGPVGWSIAGASVLTSVVLFAKKKHDIAEKKQEELLSIKRNTEELKELSAVISSLLAKTESLRDGVTDRYKAAMSLYGADYRELARDARLELGALVNDTLALARLLNERIDVAEQTGE